MQLTPAVVIKYSLMVASSLVPGHSVSFVVLLLSTSDLHHYSSQATLSTSHLMVMNTYTFVSENAAALEKIAFSSQIAP